MSPHIPMSSPAECDFPHSSSFVSLSASHVLPMISRRLPEPLITKPEPNKSVDSFRDGIQRLITRAEGSHFKMYSITMLCKEFSFQRRRLYDVVNVLESIGCCTKKGVDSLEWVGLANVVPTFIKLQQILRVNDPNLSLRDIFPSERCVTITHLTLSFVMMFFALRMESVDMKQMATFMSRNNGRYKTTLCKLYQISHILEASGIIAKSSIPGEMRIRKPYFELSGFVAQPRQQRKLSIISIDSLLNRHLDDFEKVIELRQNEFISFTCPKESTPDSEYSIVSSPI